MLRHPKHAAIAFRGSICKVRPHAMSPMDTPMGDITHLLHEWRGSREAENQLFTLVLPNRRSGSLSNAARAQRPYSAGHRAGGSGLFPHGGGEGTDWQNRKHFYAIAARAMRRHLIDHARGRPSAEFVALEGFENLLPADSEKVDLAICVLRQHSVMRANMPPVLRVTASPAFVAPDAGFRCTGAAGSGTAASRLTQLPSLRVPAVGTAVGQVDSVSMAVAMPVPVPVPVADSGPGSVAVSMAVSGPVSVPAPAASAS